MLADILIYNPVLVFTLPLYAITCDWTEALVLLRSAEDIDRQRYIKKQKQIKNIFLSISVIVILAMWVNLIAEFMKAFNIEP